MPRPVSGITNSPSKSDRTVTCTDKAKGMAESSELGQWWSLCCANYERRQIIIHLSERVPGVGIC